jgi:anaerobic ribonucleoside-triphosphate reductase activating protein
MYIGITGIDHPRSDFSVIVYLSGCEHNCLECQNPDLQEIQYQSVDYIYDRVESTLTTLPAIDALVFSGGDPLHPSNVYTVRNIMRAYQLKYCIYTGYNVEYVKTLNLPKFELLKCGKYDNKLSQKSGKYKDKFVLASSNQCFYDTNYNIISENGVLYL